MVDWKTLETQAEQDKQAAEQRQIEWEKHLKLTKLRDRMWPSLDEHAEDPLDPHSPINDSHATKWAENIIAFVTECKSQKIDDRIDAIEADGDTPLGIAREMYILAREERVADIAGIILRYRELGNNELCEAVRQAVCNTIPRLLTQPQVAPDAVEANTLPDPDSTIRFQEELDEKLVDRVRGALRDLGPTATQDAIQKKLRERHGSGVNRQRLIRVLDYIRDHHPSEYKVLPRRRSTES